MFPRVVEITLDQLLSPLAELGLNFERDFGTHTSEGIFQFVSHSGFDPGKILKQWRRFCLEDLLLKAFFYDRFSLSH